MYNGRMNAPATMAKLTKQAIEHQRATNRLLRKSSWTCNSRLRRWPGIEKAVKDKHTTTGIFDASMRQGLSLRKKACETDNSKHRPLLILAAGASFAAVEI